MSLYQLKRKTDINIDKIRVVEQILDFVDYEINENKEKFTNNELIVSKNLWDHTIHKRHLTCSQKNFGNE